MKILSKLTTSDFEIYEKNKSSYITLEDFITKVRGYSGKPDNKTFVWLDMDYGYYDEPGSPEFHIGAEND